MAIIDIVNAYNAGKMSPEQMKELEDDVANGLLMLPRGVTLKAKSAAPKKAEPVLLSQAITDAYVENRMSDKQRSELESDVRNGLVKLRPQSGLPEFQDGKMVETTQPLKPPDPTFADKALGTAQTAGTVAASLFGGFPGQIIGTLEGFKDLGKSVLDGTYDDRVGPASHVYKFAMGGAERGTKALQFNENNEYSQAQLQNIAAFTDPLNALNPALVEIGAASRLLNTAKPVIAENIIAPASEVVRERAGQAAQVIQQQAQRAGQAVRDILPQREQGQGAPSVGAAARQQAEVRLALNEELPYPLKMTQGTATRNPDQLKFEIEAAKLPVGAALRETATENRNRIDANFDAFIDETGAMATSAGERGKSIMSVVDDKIAKDRANIQAGYAMARAAGELEAPATMPTVANLFNEWGLTAQVSVPIVKFMLGRGQELKVLKVLDDGTVVPVQAPLENIVQFRKDVGRNTKWDDKQDSGYGVDFKKAVDADTQTAGGKLYQKANAMRAKLGAEIERRVLVRDLIDTKPGSTDRKVAYENVFDKIMSSATSLDQLRDFKIYLLKEGDAGKQAWAEIQGGLVKDLKDTALNGATRDEKGNLYFKADAFTKKIEVLDQSGKLDLVFGTKGAEKMRLLRDMANDVSTVPRGVANESGTATTMVYLMDLMFSASTSIPAPVASVIKMIRTNVKNKKLAKRVEQALDVSNLRNNGGAQQ